MVVSALLGLVGLALLVKASDAFVEGAARVATILRVSPVVCGAIIIGFGTSLPEMLVSGIAAGRGDLDLGIGNIAGSNIANLTLVLGVAALIVPVSIRSETIRREVPLSVGAVVALAVFVQGGLNRTEGLILAAAMAAVIVFLIRSARSEPVGFDDGAASDGVDDADPTVMRREAIRTVIGLVGTVIGADLLVRSATSIADEIGVSDGFVGLTLVALGTSLPELVAAAAAARRGETDLIIGNLLGSNIFNSLGVGAIVALVGPGPILDAALSGIAMWAMIAVAFAAALFMTTGRRVVRWEAIVLLTVYLLTIPLVARGEAIEEDRNETLQATELP